MPAKLDLLNKRFGRLTVIESAPNKGKRSQWKCKCDCGNEIITLTESLRSGSTKSCGCLKIDTARQNGLKTLNNLVGQKFGKLIVIEYAGSNRNRSSWKCECECGKEVIVNQMELVKGDTLSCGCLKSSFAELQIEKILKENNISFKREYSFPDLLSENNIPLRFDFAIFDDQEKLQYLIEYDGEQHFLNKTDNIWTDDLNKRQNRDNIKNQYCLKNNINLYRIPYWEKNNLTFDLITNQKFLIK